LRLRQVLHNLLSNAIKYTESGAIFFEARILANDHAGQLIEFRVIDQGIGMKKEDIDRVQMPFEQVRSHLSAHPNSPSTGLGLSISNHLVHLMESQLIIESVPNLGTNVHFDVAFSRTCSLFTNDAQQHYVHPLITLKGLRALVVEDHPASRQILLLQLQTLGIHADSCQDGEEALRKIQTNVYDLLLTDHSMPGMYGPDLANKVRDIGYSDLIIVGITADIYASQVREDLINAGMNSVLIKPISLERLQSELQRLFGGQTNPQSKKSTAFSKDMETLILEEVLKVQMEVLRLMSKPLDRGELRSLIHKIKGGALLSNDELLVNQCAQLEESKASSELIQKSFCSYLTTSNQFLEKQIRKLKPEPSSQK
jgi:two-component system sensor histidine kinase EvgS